MTDQNDTIRDFKNEWLPSFGKHSIIDVMIDIFTVTPARESFSCRSFSSICPGKLNSLLSRCDWTTMSSFETDLEGALLALYNNLNSAIDTLAPLKKVCPNKKYAPWIGPQLRQLMDRRNATHRRYKRTGRAELLSEFLRLNEEVDVRLTEERNSYMQKHLSDALNNNKNIWREMRNLGLLPKAKEEELHGFSPEVLNAHFAGISTSPLENINDAMDLIMTADEEGFSFKPINFSDVVLAVSHFSSQARGEDGIPQQVIAKALPAIGEFLVNIFNSSFASGVFPGAWKRAQLIALRKNVAPSTAADFRPIALLCFLSKVLEKIAHTQITEYLNINNLLDPLQAGFRKHHATQTALLKLTDDIRMSMDKRKMTLLLLFDFSKAFDTISPTRLLRKLRQLGFSRTALMWIKSYLQGRSQTVITQSQGNSNYLETNLGVPQGSVLGPLLFCLYVNDLQDLLNDRGINHIFYADDLQIYLDTTKDGFVEAVARLSSAAQVVAEWAESSGLKLNASKTKAIFFGSRKNVNDLESRNLPGVELRGGGLIPFSSEVVSLGVVLDSKLTWKPQIDNIASKVNRALYSLRFIRAATNETLRKRLVESLIQPHLDYCTVVYLDATDEQRTRLQRLSNSCVRYIYGVRWDEHITPYRKRLGWLRMDSRRLYFIALLMYKAVRMREPKYLAECFVRHTPRSSARGEPQELKVPRVGTEIGVRTFQVQGARLWNLLPSSLRHLPSISAFKGAVRRHLLDIDP